VAVFRLQGLDREGAVTHYHWRERASARGLSNRDGRRTTTDGQGYEGKKKDSIEHADLAAVVLVVEQFNGSADSHRRGTEAKRPARGGSFYLAMTV
jgi:hypothetical protein